MTIQGQSAVVRVNDSPRREYVRRSVGLLPAHYSEIQSIAAMEKRSVESVMRSLLVLGLIQRRSEGVE
jgi:hypothetical protein